MVTHDIFHVAKTAFTQLGTNSSRFDPASAAVNGTLGKTGIALLSARYHVFRLASMLHQTTMNESRARGHAEQLGVGETTMMIAIAHIPFIQYCVQCRLGRLATLKRGRVITATPSIVD